MLKYSLCTVNNVFLNNTISSFHDLKEYFNMRNGKNPTAYKHDKQGKGLPNKCISERYAQRSQQL